MILSGIISIALDAYLMILRFHTAEFSRFLVLVITLLMLAYAVCEITVGIRGFSFVNQASMGRRFRAVGAKINAFRRLSITVIILALIEVIFSLFLGIILWQLAVMIVFGILLPLIYLLTIRSLQS